VKRFDVLKEKRNTHTLRQQGLQNSSNF